MAYLSLFRLLSLAYDHANLLSSNFGRVLKIEWHNRATHHIIISYLLKFTFKIPFHTSLLGCCKDTVWTCYLRKLLGVLAIITFHNRIWPHSMKYLCKSGVQSWPKVLRMTHIFIFTMSAASVCMMAICIYSRMLWVIRWIPLCHTNELNPPKNISTAFQPCHKRTRWHHVSDSLVNTGVSVDEDNAGDHSVMVIEFE